MTNNALRFLEQKLEGIHAALLQAHKDSKNFVPSITGAEREIINRSLLELILAPGYRVGTGTIIDQNSKDSGQVDIVIEQPFSLSFPINSDQNRLFLAPSVCAAFEVKSDLVRQGSDAMEKVAKIKALHRIPVGKGVHKYDYISIPSFTIGFHGPATEEGIENIYKVFSIPFDSEWNSLHRRRNILWKGARFKSNNNCKRKSSLNICLSSIYHRNVTK